MKLAKYLAAILFIASAAPAAAGEVNFTNVGAMLHMGNIAAGQFGNISYNNPGSAIHMTEGFLAPKTEIVFSYTFSGPVKNNAGLSVAAAYNYWDGGDHYIGAAGSIRNTPPTDFLNGDAAAGFVNGSATAPLVLTTANLTKGGTTGSYTVTNDSFGIAGFVSTLKMLFSNPNILSLTYNVRSLATPLPAALPMFAALMGGMFISRKRRKAIAA